MSEACVRLCEGQSHDLALQEQSQVSQSEYLDMIGRKTAALMSCAAETGAVLGGADDEAAQALRQFGFDLGVAFQIRDDILGIWGDPQETGKPVGADLSRRRCSYPVIVALERALGADRDAILAAQGGQSSNFVAMAMAALERLGARDTAEEMIAQAHERAWSALKHIRLQPRAERELRALAGFLAVRQR
jgi:geranylgeranyl diphosphate synthase type I